MRRNLIDLGFRAFAATGLHRLAAPFTQGLGLILTFHRVAEAPDSAFDPQAGLRIAPSFMETVLDALAEQGVEIVALDDALSRLVRAARGEPVSRFAVLTFDDGYRDTLTGAMPILRRRKAPFTLFATSGFADRTARLWWVELEEAIRRLDEVTWRAGGKVMSAPARNPAEKGLAFEQAYRDLRELDEAGLQESVAALSEEAGIDSAALTASLCMDWEELRIAAADPLCTIGSHTVSHPRLARLDEAAARREVEESRAVLTQHLGRAPDHFCYPLGDRGAAGPREFGLAREAGYRSAVTTRPGVLFPGHAQALHALPRVSVNGLWQNRAALDAMLTGAPFLLWNGFRRLDVA